MVKRYTPDEINNGIYPKSFSLFVLESDYDALSRECEALRKDAERLDWLEAFANESEGLHLHDGFNNKYHCVGLGLKRLGRSLRKAIDDAMPVKAALPPVAVETPAEWLKGYADATADEMPPGVDERKE